VEVRRSAIGSRRVFIGRNNESQAQIEPQTWRGPRGPVRRRNRSDASTFPPLEGEGPMGRISALAAAAVRVAAAWRSGLRKGMADARLGAGWLRQALLLAALALAFPILLGLKELARIVRQRWAPWMIWPAIGMSLAAVGFEAHEVWRTLVSAPAMERVADSPPAGEENSSHGEDDGQINISPEENARMARWKRAVEEALKAAAATQATQSEGATQAPNDAEAQKGTSATGAGPTASAGSKPQADEAAAEARDPKAQDVQKQKMDAGKELNPFAGSPAIDAQQSSENKHSDDEAAAKTSGPGCPEEGGGRRAGGRRRERGRPFCRQPAYRPSAA